ncbi:transposase [Nocardia vinacea]
MGIGLAALLRQLDAACAAADELAEAEIDFDKHPDAKIITSFPGLGSLSGAWVLAEIGDDRDRFTDARGLKAFAGSAPITRSSGKKTIVLHCHIKNRRLAAVGPSERWHHCAPGPAPTATSTPAAPLVTLED